MAWYLVPSLVALRNEANRLYPNRDKSSDGSIGDAAHAGTTSDHNPDWKGAVHAYDLDEDLDGNGTDSGDELAFLAEAIRGRRDPRVKYVIYGGRIFASYGTSQRRAWTWGPYSGVNAHKKHMHVSVLSTHVGENDTSPWFPIETAPAPADDEDEDMFVMYHPNHTFWLVTPTAAVQISDDALKRFRESGFKFVAPRAADADAVITAQNATNRQEWRLQALFDLVLAESKEAAA
jgi:hypothetical protein